MKAVSKMANNKYTGTLQLRSFQDVQLTENEGTGILTGYPIVYEQPTTITERSSTGLIQFEETIARGAVSEKSISKDTALYYNHDLSAKPLCRVRTGKLQFEDDDYGLKMTAHLNLERSDCKDLYLAIKDGDISKMSFSFRVYDEEDCIWSDLDTSLPKRRINNLRYIKEVSAVADPAYDGTTINARNGEPVETGADTLERARAKDKELNTKADQEKEPLQKVETGDEGITDQQKQDEEEREQAEQAQALALAKAKAIAILEFKL